MVVVFFVVIFYDIVIVITFVAICLLLNYDLTSFKTIAICQVTCLSVLATRSLRLSFRPTELRKKFSGLADKSNWQIWTN